MQLEDERRHADQYKEQNEKVTNSHSLPALDILFKGTGTGTGTSIKTNTLKWNFECEEKAWILIRIETNAGLEH